MIRVYFRTGRNTIKSKAYDADHADRTEGALCLGKTTVITTIEVVTEGFLWWKKKVERKYHYPRYTNITTFAPGEWTRWEREDREPEEKKEQKDVKAHAKGAEVQP
jgi:hypothetical protein